MMRLLSGAGQRLVELSAGADAELWVHLVQVPLDRARADEQLGADLGIRTPVTSKPGDLRLLGRELVACLDGLLADRLAGGRQLAAGALSESLGPHRGEHLVSRAKLLARVYTTVSTPQPFAVEQTGASELDADLGAA